MKIQILAEDVANAGPYGDTQNCLLSQVLKRLGHSDVRVGGTRFSSDKGHFDFNGEYFYKKAYENSPNDKPKTEIIGCYIELEKW